MEDICKRLQALDHRVETGKRSARQTLGPSLWVERQQPPRRTESLTAWRICFFFNNLNSLLFHQHMGFLFSYLLVSGSLLFLYSSPYIIWEIYTSFIRFLFFIPYYLFFILYLLFYYLLLHSRNQFILYLISSSFLSST